MTQETLQFGGGGDRVRDVDGEVMQVLMGKGPWPLTDEQRHVLERLRWAKGAANAISIRELSERTKLGEREIKDAVRSLVIDFDLAIGGRRQEPYGYFLILTAEELEDSLRPLGHEIRALLLRYKKLGNKHRLLQLLGQIKAELENDKNGEAA
jgi:hypothetical protein